jgi:hypothetical protein
MAWATGAELAAFIGRTLDDDMTDALAAALAWGARQRPDLATTLTSSTAGADVHRAILIYASLLWREKSHPAGFATYEDLDTDSQDPGAAMVNVYRLIGSRRPKAR